MRLIYISLCLIMCAVAAHAQALKNFSADAGKFPKEMQGFLELGIKKEADEIMEKFLPLWEQEKFTSAQQSDIYDFTNLMLKKRMKPNPDFSNYMRALIGFAEGGKTPTDFKNWHRALEKSSAGTMRKFSDFIENCYVFFAKNSIYESNSIRWAADNTNYTFEFDSLPKIVYTSLNLLCYAKGDSTVILKTSGAYYPNLRLWRGTGGRVTWERAGLAAADVYCDLGNYTIDMTGSDYTADSVRFFHKKYFANVLQGFLLDKIIANSDTDNASYPRFQSYTKEIEISNLIKDAEYKGGFGMRGSKMIGTGSDDQDAQLIFKRKEKPFFVASSQSFLITPERVASENASICIYWEVDTLPGILDSIVHPGTNFKYINKDKKVTVIRDTRGAQQSPFFDSYHDVDIYLEELTWKIDDPIIDFKMGAGQGESKMRIESANYFSENRFKKIQGINDESPLYVVKKFAQKYGTDYVIAEDLAKEMRMQPSEVRGMLMYLSNNGFLSYDFKSDKAMIKDKLYYYLEAFSNKTDYDGIIIESQIAKLPNASINLLNFDLRIRGAASVVLSDSNNVFIVPSDQELLMRTNRDFSFKGRLRAGRLDFYGNNFQFLYDDFKIKLNDIDSMRIKVPGDVPNANGEYPLIAVQNYLKGISGEIIIDSLNNKSGVKKAPSYPLFTCTSNSYVYWDNPNVFGGVYHRDLFYFKVEPFEMRGTDKVRKEDVRFDGTFVSNIFPDMKQSLLVQEDYSLGFEMDTPPEGLQAYQGKGTFTNKLKLSNKGLEGKGNIDYLSSKTIADHIYFFPDSTIADANDFEIRREKNYPSVKANNVDVVWVPKKDYMDIHKREKDFDLYDKQVYLDGSLRLAPKGLGGYGTAGFYDAQLLSRDFNFEQTRFGADSSGFRLKSDDEGTFAIDARNINSQIDLNAKTGKFKANDTRSRVDFPANQYTSNIEKFDWDITARELQFKSDMADGAIYTSTNALQDSLRWNSPWLNYSLSDYLMKANDVKEILVADAQVKPVDGRVVVEKGAKMQTLNNATVIANTTTKYHTFVNANIDISSRKRYEGTGDYEYTDQANVKHLIRLERIGIDTSKATYAYGTVDDTAQFVIAPNTNFKGQVKIRAPKQQLFFEGYAHFSHNCEKIGSAWFSFASEIDPKGVSIPIKNPVNETKEPLFSGFCFTNDSDGVYATFITEKRKKTDEEIMTSAGTFSYDNATAEYRITPVNDSDAYLSLNSNSCTIYGEGFIDTRLNFGQYQVKVVGSMKKNLQNDSIEIEAVMDMDFKFSDKALEAMSDVLASYSNLKATNDTRPIYGKSMTRLIGKEKWEKANAEIAQSGALKRVPEELRHSIVLSDIKLVYHPELNSFKNTGPIGIGFINKNIASRQVTGFCELQKRKGGDVFNLYFELDANTWYYFNYQRGVMQAVSSDSKFNEIIANEKEKNRYSKGKDDMPDYQYMLSTERKKNEFIKKYTGVEEE